VFLGRKKRNDPPLRGRADYVLAVNGVGRWVLEIKSPSEKIGIDEIEQALSYARHPEISGSNAAITNGLEFVLYSTFSKASDTPLIRLKIDSPEDLASKIEGILSPSAIARDCAPKMVDLGLPLADGLRSRSVISGGKILYEYWGWESTMALPPLQGSQMDELCRRMKGLQSNLNGGEVWQDDSSRIKARLNWTVPHEEVLLFSEKKGLMEVEYVSLDSRISTDKQRPTTFDVIEQISIEHGEQVFDIQRWERVGIGIKTSMSYRGVTAHLVGWKVTVAD
jgi:hypothetical protein